MSESRINKVKSNIIFGFASQLIIMIVSIILPRLIIFSYGSDLNGLTSAVTQVFTYIALLQAGIGNASLNLLYKNFVENDQNDISKTISATKRYFKGMLPIYICAVLIFMTVFPIITKTDADHTLIRAIILLQGAANLVDFYFSNTFTQLLLADGKNYVISNLNLLVKVLSAITQIVLINLGFSIVIVQGTFVVLYVVKAVILNGYIKSNYPWLELVKNADKNILKQRNAFMVHEISSVIFQSTDIFLITTFCSTLLASVYSVYLLVYTSLNSFISIFNKGIDFILGQEYNKDGGNYLTIHDAYESMYMALVFASMTVACILTVPFVSIYTSGIHDVNYIDPLLPYLFALIQVLSCSRTVSSRLIAIAGHAKNTQTNTIVEAVINLGASLVFVQIWGIYGVLFGTIVALLYRTNDIILYANIKILKRKPFKTYRNIIVNFILMFLFLFVARLISISIIGVLDFLIWGIVTSIVVFSIYGVITIFLNKEIIGFVKRLVKRKSEKGFI